MAPAITGVFLTGCDGEPTEPSGPFEIVNKNAIRDFTSMHVLGEIENISEDYYAYVTVAADFFDAQGKRVAVKDAYASPKVIAPGAKAAFDIQLFDASMLDIDHYELFLTPGAPEKRMRPAEGLTTITSASGLVDSRYQVAGQIRNDGEKTADVDEVVATFYDSDGLVVAVEEEFVNEELEPGGALRFEITVFDAFELYIRRFSLIVDAQPLESD